MGNLFAHVVAWIAQNPSWTDAILAAGMLVQGELTIILGTYLALGGTITWTQFFVMTLAALFAGETFVYALGRTIRTTRFGWRFYRKRKHNKRTQLYTYQLKQNMGKFFMIGKFVPAMNILMLFLAGWTRTKFGPYFRAYVRSALVWFASITFLAYLTMSGIHLLKASNVIRDAEIGIVAVFVVLFGGELLLKNMFDRYERKEERTTAIEDLTEEDGDGKE